MPSDFVCLICTYAPEREFSATSSTTPPYTAVMGVSSGAAMSIPSWARSWPETGEIRIVKGEVIV